MKDILLDEMIIIEGIIIIVVENMVIIVVAVVTIKNIIKIIRERKIIDIEIDLIAIVAVIIVVVKGVVVVTEIERDQEIENIDETKIQHSLN